MIASSRLCSDWLAAKRHFVFAKFFSMRQENQSSLIFIDNYAVDDRVLVGGENGTYRQQQKGN
jgi:hypothetical protein